MRGPVAAAAGLLLLLAGGACAASIRGSLYRPVPEAHIEQSTHHTAQAELDKVEHLPGWGKPSPGLFSGCAFHACSYLSTSCMRLIYRASHGVCLQCVLSRSVKQG